MHIYFFHVLLTSTNFFNKKTLICKDWVANKFNTGSKLSVFFLSETYVGRTFQYRDLFINKDKLEDQNNFPKIVGVK
jgi:hypothetical protein